MFFLTCGSSALVRVEHEGDATAWLVGTLAATNVQGHGLPLPQELCPIRVFCWASCSWPSEGLFGQSFSVGRPIQALRGLPCLGSFSVLQCIRHIEAPIWGPPQFRVSGIWWASLYCLVASAGVWGERGYGWWLHPLCMTQQYCLASMAAQLSSTGISHHNLLPHIPLICLSAVNSSHRPGMAPQPLNQLPDTAPSGVCMAAAKAIWFSFHLGCHRSAVSVSALNVSSDSDSYPSVGLGPLLQFPHPLRAGPVLLTLLLFPLVPSSYWVLPGSIYSFLLVRYSSLFSAGVLHALQCLKVYSWCIHGERCPRPPTPPPSCSSFNVFLYCSLYYVAGVKFFLVSQFSCWWFLSGFVDLKCLYFAFSF